MKKNYINPYKASECRAKKNKGFTLIELLIVITIIGILGSIISFFYPNAVKRARDAKRMSDAKQYQIAIEKYANRNQKYPIASGITIASTLCATLSLDDCPDDPYYVYGTGSDYQYFSDTAGTRYVIVIHTEASRVHMVFCSNGTVGEMPWTWSYPSDGICPI